MKPYFVKTPSLFPILYRKQIWSFPSNQKNIYLTFDDGPTPEITEWVLTILKSFHAKVTFFCIGKNIEKHPQLFNQILDDGHAIGNHTYDHLNGWKTNTEDYLDSVLKTENLIDHFSTNKNQKLFRPPYGRIRITQTKELIKNHYSIVMWSVLSADFDNTVTEKKCYHNIVDNTTNGSILVFHDSRKASKNLKAVLPKILKYYSEKGYNFRSIEPTDIAEPN